MLFVLIEATFTVCLILIYVLLQSIGLPEAGARGHKDRGPGPKPGVLGWDPGGRGRGPGPGAPARCRRPGPRPGPGARGPGRGREPGLGADAGHRGPGP